MANPPGARWGPPLPPPCRFPPENSGFLGHPPGEGGCHNRYRQHELAMEKRILTDRFSLRHGVSLHGILFTDAFKPTILLGP